MTKIEKFEDTLAWQKGRALAHLSDQAPRNGVFAKTTHSNLKR